METLPDGTKRSRRQIKGPIKFIPQEMSPEPKKRDRTRGQKRKRVSICEEERFEVQEPALRERRQRQSAMQKKTPKADDTRTDCTSCKGPGDNENLVRHSGGFGVTAPPALAREEERVGRPGMKKISLDCSIHGLHFLFACGATNT
uniref:Uncharacterized protein n=1 Tax=Hucho hucho TaxID=62062 RepID=A0A4W5LKZ1_9TELE